MGNNDVALSTRVDRDTAYTVESLAEENDWSRSQAIRNVIQAYFEERGEGQHHGESAPGESPQRRSAHAGVSVMYSTLGASLAVGVGFLLAGFMQAGIGLVALAASMGMVAGVGRAFGWGAILRAKLDGVTTDLRDLGVVGYYRVLFDSASPVEEPTTPVERAARWDRSVPALIAIMAAYVAVGYVIVELGVLTALGALAAFVYLLGFVAVMLVPTLVIAVSTLAQITLDTVGRVPVRDTDTDAE